MSGLFRRLRRRKTADADEEPAEEPPGDAPEDPDIYPHRAPGEEGDPDIVAEPATAEETRSETGSDSDLDFGPAPSEPATAPEGPTPRTPSPDGEVRPEIPDVRPDLAPASPSAPPPLPAQDEDAGRSTHRPLTASNRCFLCGTEMTGSFCPTCRMTWNE
jgi:hypothetical protein